MKLILLVDGNYRYYKTLLNSLNNKKVISFEINKNKSEESEIKELDDLINNFRKTEGEILVIKYSGKEAVIQEIGDENSDMIIGLSSNKNSPFYIRNPIDVFSEFVQLLELEETLV